MEKTIDTSTLDILFRHYCRSKRHPLETRMLLEGLKFRSGNLALAQSFLVAVAIVCCAAAIIRYVLWAPALLEIATLLTVFIMGVIGAWLCSVANSDADVRCSLEYELSQYEKVREAYARVNACKLIPKSALASASALEGYLVSEAVHAAISGDDDEIVNNKSDTYLRAVSGFNALLAEMKIGKGWRAAAKQAGPLKSQSHPESHSPVALAAID